LQSMSWPTSIFLMRRRKIGNVGTFISFRLGATDARLLESELLPEFSASDLMRLPNYHIYLKLMVEGVVSSPFSAQTLRISE
jgi:hypothetical protein